MKKKNGVTEAQQVQIDRLTDFGQRTTKVREQAARLAQKADIARRFTDEMRRAEDIVERG